MASKTKVIQPFEGFQEKFVRSNLDFVIGGGSMGGGKTAAAVMCSGEPSLDSRYRAVYPPS